VIYLQGSVAMQLRCGGIFDNRVIEKIQQNVPLRLVHTGDKIDSTRSILSPVCTEQVTKSQVHGY